ncbi:MAG: hypothetical protein WC770_03965 [Phycisphaerae bacterium]|jgi:hypothetical protein
MSILAYHHKELVAFLESVSGTTSELSLIIPQSEEWNLFNLIIKSGDRRIRQRKAAKAIYVKSPYLNKKVQPNLNELLKAFSEKHGIQPPIRLYFSTNGKYSGGHFACCDIKDDTSPSDHFIKIEDLQSMLANVGQKLATPKGINTDAIKLHVPIIEISPGKNQNLFCFEYRWSDFIGRDAEMERLRKFVNYSEEKLIWWTIIGKGGIGKSRLALELCVELKEKGWHAGFLIEPLNLKSLEMWQPSKPTLIIVDTNIEIARSIGRLIINFDASSINWHNPVRIIFISREEDKIIDCFTKIDEEILINNLSYGSVHKCNESASLKVAELDVATTVIMIDGLFQKNNNDRQKISATKIKEYLNDIGVLGIPLYIMFATDAFIRNIDVLRWDKKKLHQNLLMHNIKVWENQGINLKDPLDSKHINLLILATIANGITLQAPKYVNSLSYTDGTLKGADLLPFQHEFYESKYQILCGSECAKILSPLLPDIYGEYFVLHKWKNSMATKHGLGLLLKLAWKYNPEGTRNFIFRIINDFPEETEIDNIVEVVCANTNSDMMYAYLLMNIIRAYSINSNLNQLLKYYKMIESLWMSKYKETIEMSGMMMVALVDVIGTCHEFEESEKVAVYYKFAKSLWSKHRNNFYIFLEFVRINIGFAIFYAEKKDEPKKVLKFYNRVERLWHDDFLEDIGISIVLGKILLYLTDKFIQQNERNKAKVFYQRLKSLSEKKHRSANVSEWYKMVVNTATQN